MMFFHHENPHEASNGFVKAVTPQRFSKFSNVKFSPLCVGTGPLGVIIMRTSLMGWPKIDLSEIDLPRPLSYLSMGFLLGPLIFFG